MLPDIKEEDMTCRICHSTEEWLQMLRPCRCRGSMSYVHSDCLIKWIDVSKSDECEVCLTKYKFREWTTDSPSLKTYLFWMFKNIKDFDANFAILCNFYLLFYGISLIVMCIKSHPLKEDEHFKWIPYQVQIIIAYVCLGFCFMFLIGHFFFNRHLYLQWKTINQISRIISDYRQQVN